MTNMKLSVIIIGKDSAKTLDLCITSVKKAITNTPFITDHELIYVDAISKDNSLDIANKQDCQTIKITKGFTSAALGRNLGLLAANYDALLFLDGDMELNEHWFTTSENYYQKYRALRGQRHELTYQQTKLVKENSTFDQIETVEPVKRPGGFLMIDKALLRNVKFSSDLLDEEESDFYAKIYRENKITQVPIPAYKHHNYKEIQSKILNYLLPFKNIGFLVSMIKSVRSGYFSGYFFVQKKYILAILASILLYIAFFLNQPILMVAWGLICLYNLGLRFISVVLTSIFLPYKFITSLIFIGMKKETTFEVAGKSFSMNASNPNFEELAKVLQN